MAFQGISIDTVDDTVFLTAPFHPATGDLAHAINGKYRGLDKTWVFDVRDLERVRGLARRIWGHDGTPVATVTVRLTLGWDDRHGQDLWFGGRMIAKRWERDKRVTLGEGVIIIEGGFPDSGGSVRNPRLEAHEGTVLEIRDIPAGHRHLAEDSAWDFKVAQPDPAPASADVDVEALTAEREQLLARVAEIDALLPAPQGVEATTEQAAQALGVSVRTVQRWAQTGRVTAFKNPTGHWVINITIPEPEPEPEP